MLSNNFRMCQMPQVRCSILVTIIVLSSLCTIVVQTHPMTKHTNNFKRSHNTAALLEETKSLPPDTFRQLAKALYQRGGENILDKKLFYNSSVTCNDGSVAGYYIQRNHDSKRWIIFLEGMAFIIQIQCNLDLVTHLVSAKTVTKSHNVTKLNDFM